MGVLIDALTAKYAAQNPPLDVAAGIRQDTELDAESNLAMTVSEMDAHILERLDAREKEVLGELQSAAATGNYFWPFPSQVWPNLMPAFDNAQRQAVTDNQLSTAADAVEDYVKGDLFFKASNRSPEFGAKFVQLLGDKGMGRPGQADLKVAKVKAAILGLLSNIGKGQSERSRRLRTAQMVRARSQCSEYRPNDCRPDDNYYGRALDACCDDAPFGCVD
jgi:hypothetical protein